MTELAVEPTNQAPEKAGPRWAHEPFVMGSPDQFAHLRAWLADVGYTERELCAAANVPWLGRLPSLEGGRTVFVDPVDVQSLLLLLFIEGRHIPWTTVREILPAAELELLTDLMLLQPSVADATNCVGSVALFPSENVWVVSDRLTLMETVGGKGSPSDIVFTPLTPETHRFVRLMPRPECRDYLELCAGTGIAALLAAKNFATHAYSADITERCTRFARFNAALNAIPNFTAVMGDLYEPVAGKQFDLISAHPPYVPNESTEMVFRDGGADGEQITRRIIAGLSEYLRPGGLFWLDCMLTDRESDPTEHRIRRMLGPDEDEFDILVFRSGMVDTKVYQADQLAGGRITAASLVRQREFFKRAGIERLVGVQVLIQRRVEQRPVVTRHNTISGTEATAAELLWLLRYSTRSATWRDEDVRRLLDVPLRAFSGTEVITRSVLEDGSWWTASTAVSTARPFGVSVPCPRWFPTMLQLCDGRATAREHLVRLRAEGLVPPNVSDDDFAQLIRELADIPLLELADFPLSKQ